MRATLADPSIARRYAGRFVWLELDFDKPQNEAFLVGHGAAYTPTEYIIDPATERVTATQLGAMTLPELERFLERGERGATATTPADVALARGDELMASAKGAEAVTAYTEALRVADPSWSDRDRAAGALVTALSTLRRYHECAEAAATYAAQLPRNESFGRVIYHGLSCCESEPDDAARAVLLPLAEEAVALPSTVRDHRFGMYDALISAHKADLAVAAAWGKRWLDELDTIQPANDEERLAVDIARFEAGRELGDVSRVLGQLEATERALPTNYATSLRLAQAYAVAKRYPDVLAACERGLAHVTGPLARMWLLRLEGEAYVASGKPDDARRTYTAALEAAKQIATPDNRDRAIARLTKALSAVETPPR